MRLAFIAIAASLILSACNGTESKDNSKTAKTTEVKDSSKNVNSTENAEVTVTSNDYEKITVDPQLFSNTVHELNNVVMGNNFSPIVASRNYMYASVAAYEVIAA